MVKKDIRNLSLDLIIVDNSLNPREGALDQEAVLNYSEHIEELPMMHVFEMPEPFTDRVKYYLTRGFHRFAAHQLAGETKANFEVHSGTWDEAREDADLDNLKHGIQLNRRERRLVIERYLKRHSERSDVWIAKDTYTTDKTVRDVREKLEETSEIPRHDVLIDVNGTRRPRTVARAGVVEQRSRGAGEQGSFAEQAEAEEDVLIPWEQVKAEYEAAHYEADQDEEQEIGQELVEAGLAEEDESPLLGEIYERDEPGEAEEFGEEPEPAAEPRYLEVWELETRVRSWLAATIADRHQWITVLQAIKDDAAGGRKDLEGLTASLVSWSYRSSDLRAAYCNVLEQLIQSEKRELSLAPLPPISPASPPPPPAPTPVVARPALPALPAPVIAAAPLRISVTVLPNGNCLLDAFKGEEAVARKALMGRFREEVGQEVQGLVDEYYQAEHPAPLTGSGQPVTEQPAEEPEAEAEWLQETIN